MGRSVFGFFGAECGTVVGQFSATWAIPEIRFKHFNQ